ncbi:hypothetical protein LTR70_004740 [Exophiala xenobiotica]|uniref:DUF6590 domain-containing protein n=1 Tax=Lithohypha guttulata TaxID=1690604 RepID=A0ABR0KC97_9EURO|nr:hypothetical protein LTR24_004356 [Lithohypha guttulata]KAK5319954.1 hypothetical protein LTR70_004740 [Exophiala xenobiotica]
MDVPATTGDGDLVSIRSLELEEDIPAELEDFVLVSRLGMVADAQRLVSDVLWRHLRYFPVVAEIAEFFLGSGLWESLDDLVRELDRRRISFDDYNEKEVLRRLRTFGTKKVSQMFSLREFNLSSENPFPNPGSINYNNPVKVQNIEIQVLVASKGPRSVAQVYLQFAERHFRGLIQHRQWWEATRIFTILCSRSGKRCPEAPVTTIIELYAALIPRLNSDGSIESSTVPGQSDEEQETLICALVTKSMFMDTIVTLLQEQRQPPTSIDAWELHTEVGQLLQQISRDLSRAVSESRYYEIWKSCQIRLTNLQQSGIAKPPSSYANPGSGASWSATTPKRLVPSDNRQSAIIASSSEISPQLPRTLPSAIHSNEQSVPRQVPESQLAMRSVSGSYYQSTSHYKPTGNEWQSLRSGYGRDSSAQIVAASPRTIEPSTLRAGQTPLFTEATSRRVPGPTKVQRQVIAGNDGNDDDDGDSDELPFTNMQSSIGQLFTRIPVEDFVQRVHFLNENRKLLTKDHFDAVDADFLEQSIQFRRMGKHAATRSCISSLALLRMSKNKNYQQLDKLLLRLLINESAEKKEYLEMVKALDNTVEQEAQQAAPLPVPQGVRSKHSNPPREPSWISREQLEEEDTAVEGVDYHRASLGSWPSYRTRKADFFKPGKVFATTWAEPTGRTSAITANVVRDRYGENYLTQVRRMVSINNKHGACWCVAINTYGGRGLCKPGFRRANIDAHTIIYDSSKSPRPMSKEPESAKRPIAVKMAAGQSLDHSSRVHLGQPYTVQHYVKVMDVGQVVAEDLETLIGYVKEELFS